MTASPPPPTSASLYKRLLGYVWPYCGVLFAGVIAMIVGGLADAALVKLTGPLIDELFVHRNQGLMILLPLAMTLRPASGWPKARLWVGLGIASFFGVVLNQVLFTEGIARTTPEHSAVINAGIPTWTMLVAVCAGQERLGGRRAEIWKQTRGKRSCWRRTTRRCGVSSRSFCGRPGSK